MRSYKLLVLTCALLLVPTAMATHGGPVHAAVGAVFGSTPVAGVDTVYAACHGDALTGCTSNGNIQSNYRFLFSSCADASDPTGCSQFTGTLRFTVSDGGCTAADVYEVTFYAGSPYPIYWFVSGDQKTCLGSMTLDVDPEAAYIEPTYERLPATPVGGAWHLWIVPQ